MSPRVILASQSPRRQELLKHIYKYFEIVPSNASEDIAEADPARLVERLSEIKAKEVFNRVQDEADMVPEMTGMKRLSRMFKASKLADTDDLMVIGADTIVVLDGEILGKPRDEEDAVNMLKRLQGREHEVYTGVTVICNAGNTEFSKAGTQKVMKNDVRTDGEMMAAGISSLADDSETKNISNNDHRAGSVGVYGCTDIIVEEIAGTSVRRITFHEKTTVHIAAMSDEEIKKYVETGNPLDKAGSYGIQTVFTKYVSGIEGDYNNVVGLPVARLYAELKMFKSV